MPVPRSATSRLAAAFLAAALAAGCATPAPPRPRTTVVLMPDEDGRVGAVTVSTAAGSREVDTAWAATTAELGASAPAAAAPLDGAALEAAHGPLLGAQPTPPRSFTLYFRNDRAVLTDASKARLPELLAAARARKPTEITVFGHADATGSRERNLKLSAERAQAVAQWLRESDPSLDEIAVQYFGDSEPAVGAGERKAEPLNRRAEVLIL
ncbi:OmpA family protein [Aquincola sp. MAHUQ-54]|uniref:OmpA family protein n=1 Tax=Aquincola agrisoli TaxID=3119538 RepID=A0AAW9QH69_9BURK